YRGRAHTDEEYEQMLQTLALASVDWTWSRDGQRLRLKSSAMQSMPS
ncbi:hypothetical protein A2U01_0090895, partial [Trifolium medium]|nr:hypothetical protein [Trifolium medium]